jgi:hypothetical protein
MFKMLRDYLKIRRYRKAMDVLNDLCDGKGSCENCKAYLKNDGATGKHCCAQCYVLEQYMERLEQMKKEYGK